MKLAAARAELAAKEPMKTGIIMSIVQHVQFPVEVGNGTITFGQRIDEMIGNAIAEGNKVTGFEIIISDEDWWSMTNA